MNRLSTPIPEIFFGYTAGHVGKTATFAAGFGFLYGGKELKGNPVKIRNSPAAVSPIAGRRKATARFQNLVGRPPEPGVSQKTCRSFYFGKLSRKKLKKEGHSPLSVFHFFYRGFGCEN